MYSYKEFQSFTFLKSDEEYRDFETPWSGIYIQALEDELSGQLIYFISDAEGGEQPFTNKPTLTEIEAYRNDVCDRLGV